MHSIAFESLTYSVIVSVHNKEVDFHYDLSPWLPLDMHRVSFESLTHCSVKTSVGDEEDVDIIDIGLGA